MCKLVCAYDVCKCNDACVFVCTHVIVGDNLDDGVKVVGPRGDSLDYVDNDLSRPELQQRVLGKEDFPIGKKHREVDRHDRPDNEKFDTEKPETEVKGRKRKRRRRRRVPVFTVEVLSSKTELEVRARNKVRGFKAMLRSFISIPHTVVGSCSVLVITNTHSAIL